MDRGIRPLQRCWARAIAYLPAIRRRVHAPCPLKLRLARRLQKHVGNFVAHRVHNQDLMLEFEIGVALQHGIS